MTPALVNRAISYNYDDVDTLKAYLMDPINPGEAVDSAKAVVDIFGMADFRFSGVRVGQPYYLAIHSLNATTTWSAAPVTMTLNTAYDFTDGASKAFGNNMTEVAPGVFAFFSGDLNQDEFIDPYDFPLFQEESLNFSFGYLAPDMNGDGYVDPYDFTIYQENSLNFVMSVRP
jgi:hypothetical protein